MNNHPVNLDVGWKLALPASFSGSFLLVAHLFPSLPELMLLYLFPFSFPSARQKYHLIYYCRVY